jgi:hypothetical protein
MRLLLRLVERRHERAHARRGDFARLLLGRRRRRLEGDACALVTALCLHPTLHRVLARSGELAQALTQPALALLGTHAAPHAVDSARVAGGGGSAGFGFGFGRTILKPRIL